MSIKGGFGEDATNWKGDNVGYHGLHAWLYRDFGKANKCSKCGTVTAKKYEWANISGKYSRDINDFIQLCTSCHRKMDYGTHCKRGHEVNDANSYIRKNGARRCRRCQYLSRKEKTETRHSLRLLTSALTSVIIPEMQSKKMHEMQVEVQRKINAVVAFINNNI